MRNFSKYIFTSLLAMAAIVGCASDDTEDSIIYSSKVSLSASLTQSTEGITFSFDKGDQMTIYNKDGVKVGVFSLSGDGGSDEGKFVSEKSVVMNSGESYTAVYPAISDISYSGEVRSTSGTQSANDNSDHLTQMAEFVCDFAYGVDSQVTLATTSSFVKVTLSTPAADYNDATDGVPSYMQLAITDTDATDSSMGYYTAKLTLSDITNWDNDVVAYVALPHGSEQSARSITTTLMTDFGRSYVMDFSDNNDNEISTLSNMTANALVYSPTTLVVSDMTVTIDEDSEKQQELYYGIDAERLWYWYEGYKEQWAELSVGSINARYLRVAIDCAYELEHGVENPEVYDIVIDMMRAMKDANPDIEFFATPRPLFNCYTAEEKAEKWGHADNHYWTPVPEWVMPSKITGNKTMDDGTVVPVYANGELDKDNMLEYFSEYLNLMHKHGFEITYMDLTNENQYVDPATNLWFKENLPAKLDAGVHMPLLIGPSSWDVGTGTAWLKKFASQEQKDALGISAMHNTGASVNSYGLPDFIAASKDIRENIPIWNTELHEWIGTDTEEEVLSSELLWEYIQGGFNSVITWLFFGPTNGTAHAMLWCNSDGSYTKSVKYEVFKKVVNTTADGNYLGAETDVVMNDMMVTPFIKDDQMSIAVLNKENAERILSFDLGDNREIDGQIEVTKWNGDLDKSGKETKFWATQDDLFQFAISGESLYYFTFKVK